jgi:hypothetical protein
MKKNISMSIETAFWTYIQRLNKRQKLDQQINVDFASREGQDWEKKVLTQSIQIWGKPINNLMFWNNYALVIFLQRYSKEDEITF